MNKKPVNEVPREEDRLLTIGDVAHILHVSRSLIYLLIRKGQLRTVRLGRALRFRREDLDACIRERNRHDQVKDEKKRGGRR